MKARSQRATRAPCARGLAVAPCPCRAATAPRMWQCAVSPGAALNDAGDHVSHERLLLCCAGLQFRADGSGFVTRLLGCGLNTPNETHVETHAL